MVATEVAPTRRIDGDSLNPGEPAEDVVHVTHERDPLRPAANPSDHHLGPLPGPARQLGRRLRRFSDDRIYGLVGDRWLHCSMDR